jgi:hypothetical protein
MKIVNANRIFTLISIQEDKKGTAVYLELDGSPYLSTTFDTKDYYTYQLQLYGLKDKEAFLRQANDWITEFIYIEQQQAQQLEFWIDEILFGKFEVQTYKEQVEPYSKEDWMDSYKGLLNYHFGQQQQQTKQIIKKNDLIEKLNAFLSKEIENYTLKNQFLADQKEAVAANNKALALARKVQQIIQQHS